MPDSTESPFTGGERFDPKQELHKLTDGQGKYPYEGIQDFKHKLEFQTHGLSVLENDVVSAVEKDLKTTRETLSIMLARRSHSLGLTPEQNILASSLIGEFMNRHAAVMDVYERNSGVAKDIYKEVFHRDAMGDVEVIAGPSVLYFRCHNEADYALIYSQKFLKEEPPSEEDIKIANSSGGVSIPAALNPALSGAIIAENARGRPFDSVAKSLYEHEKRHALNKLFLDGRKSINTFYEMKNAKTPEERTYQMRQYMRYVRSDDESRAADEILAYSSTGENPQSIMDRLTKSRADGGLYDYFFERLKGTHHSDGVKTMESFLVRVLGEEMRENIKESVQQVFVNEYRREVKQGIESMRRLANRGYSIQESTSVLGRVPLTEWTKVSRRLVAERYLPQEKFWLPGGEGVKVVVADKGGKFYGGVILDEYDSKTGLPLYKTPQGIGSDGIAKMSVEDLKLINFPFKSAELWYEVWVRSGGDSSVKDKLGLDFSSQEQLSADVAWGKFRPYCELGSNALGVFNTYRKLLREAY